MSAKKIFFGWFIAAISRTSCETSDSASAGDEDKMATWTLSINIRQRNESEERKSVCHLEWATHQTGSPTPLNMLDPLKLFLFFCFFISILLTVLTLAFIRAHSTTSWKLATRTVERKERRLKVVEIADMCCSTNRLITQSNVIDVSTRLLIEILSINAKLFLNGMSTAVLRNRLCWLLRFAAITNSISPLLI